MNLSDIDKEDFVKEVRKLDKDCTGPIEDWRKEARENYDFYAGHQWKEQDIRILEEQRRPPITFNRCAKVIDAVSGSEIVNRQETRYLPRTVDDQAQTEVWNAAASWVRDLTDAEDEESDSFKDTLICGMGWINTHVDYIDNPDGDIRMERVDPLEMKWDTTATAKNITDAGWMLRERWVKADEIKSKWPKAKVEPEQRDLDRNYPHDAEKIAYTGDTGRNYRPDTEEYRVLELQWYELEPFYRAVNPQTGKVEEVGEELSGEAIKQHRRKYYRAFVCSNEMLERTDCPVNNFTYKCITGKRDKNGSATTWYGMMRGMMDPQLWANKFFSQILHIFNSTPKGVTFHETGALKDAAKAREDINRPEGMVELNPGGLNRIKHEAAFQIPSNLDRMLQYAVQAIPDVSGVNPEFMATVDRDQPGVVEMQRNRQVLTILSAMFDSLRRYRKLHGRILIEFIDKYISDERLVRIVGPEGEKFVPLTKSENVRFDVIVDESPNSPNSKTEAWVALTQLLPVLTSSGFPVIPEVVDYMPLPVTMTQKWKEAYTGQTEAMQKLQQELQKLKEENLILKAKREERLIMAETKQSGMVIEDKRERDRMAMEQETALASAAMKSETDTFKALTQKASNDRRRDQSGNRSGSDKGN